MDEMEDLTSPCDNGRSDVEACFENASQCDMIVTTDDDDK